MPQVRNQRDQVDCHRTELSNGVRQFSFGRETLGELNLGPLQDVVVAVVAENNRAGVPVKSQSVCPVDVRLPDTSRARDAMHLEARLTGIVPKQLDAAGDRLLKMLLFRTRSTPEARRNDDLG